MATTAISIWEELVYSFIVSCGELIKHIFSQKHTMLKAKGLYRLFYQALIFKMKNTPIKGKTKLIGFLLLFRNVDISIYKVSYDPLKIAIKSYQKFIGNRLQDLATCKDETSFIQSDPFCGNKFHFLHSFIHSSIQSITIHCVHLRGQALFQTLGITMINPSDSVIVIILLFCK